MFPGPAEVLGAGAEVLKERCRLGFRVETILRATERMLEDGIMLENGATNEADLTHSYFSSLWGIGPYAAAHCRMLLHDFSKLPVDSEVSAYLRVHSESHEQRPSRRSRTIAEAA